MRQLLMISLLLLLSGCSENTKETTDLSEPYLGQKPPGDEPEIFAREIVSTEDHHEMGITCMPDGREIYFARSETMDISSNWAIWMVLEQNGTWAEPEIAPFSGVYRDFAPFITPDGKFMLFFRQCPEDAGLQSGTWLVERKGDSWREPRFLVDAYCLTTADFQTFYFCTPASEETSRDIAMMTYENGEFSIPEKLKGEINSEQFDAHGCISHDGGMLVFDSARPGGFDRSDIYVSSRKNGGHWSQGYNLGEKINDGHNHIPSLSSDGKYLFFSSDDGDIYWVDAKAIWSLAPGDLEQ